MIFDLELVKLRRQVAINSVEFEQASYIFNFGKEIIHSLLEDIEHVQIKNILIIGDRKELIANSLKDLGCQKNNIISCNSLTELEFAPESIDLIVSFFDIEWTNDLTAYLQVYREILSVNGLIVGCFVGENSLLNLKYKFYSLENELMGKHYSHTSPFITAKDFAGLLQQYKYNNIIVSIEEIKVEYSNFLQLLKDLKYMGSNCALANTELYRIPKVIYKAILDDKVLFEETFKIIGFSATKNVSFNIKK